MASIIDIIFTIQESYITNIKKDANTAYKKNVLEAVFQNSLHLSIGHVIKKKWKLLLTNSLFKPALFIKFMRWSFFLCLKAETNVKDFKFVTANLFSMRVT